VRAAEEDVQQIEVAPRRLVLGDVRERLDPRRLAPGGVARDDHVGRELVVAGHQHPRQAAQEGGLVNVEAHAVGEGDDERDQVAVVDLEAALVRGEAEVALLEAVRVDVGGAVLVRLDPRLALDVAPLGAAVHVLVRVLALVLFRVGDLEADEVLVGEVLGLQSLD
jgi:hypothetical protein